MRPYTEEERREAVVAYIMGGETYAAAERISGIPWSTIRTWKDNMPDWWDRTMKEAWEAYDDQIKTKYGHIVEEGARQLMDTVKHGERIVDKAGNPVLNDRGEEARLPLKAKELAVIVGICQDKLNIVRGKPTSISGKVETVTDKLAELREAAAGKPVVN